MNLKIAIALLALVLFLGCDNKKRSQALFDPVVEVPGAGEPAAVLTSGTYSGSYSNDRGTATYTLNITADVFDNRPIVGNGYVTATTTGNTGYFNVKGRIDNSSNIRSIRLAITSNTGGEAGDCLWPNIVMGFKRSSDHNKIKIELAYHDCVGSGRRNFNLLKVIKVNNREKK